MNHIYCISGLGADYRIFANLVIGNATLHYINWQLPGAGETMRSYALKLASQIKHQEIILVGVSFGGMLASEISRQYAEQQEPGAKALLPFVLKKTIVISSCKQSTELPLLMRMAGAIGFHKIMPYNFLLKRNGLNRFLFDLKSKEDELYLKRLMLQENSTELIRHSINIILTWKQKLPATVVHIHGTADRLLLPGGVKADYWIKSGGHFMVWNKAKEVSNILNEIINGQA